MRETIIELIQQYAPPSLVHIIKENIKESLILKSKQVPDEQIDIGKTKIGGKPDLPRKIRWPKWKRKPLSFIAQINLADLPKHEFVNMLPSEGLLSFFYSAEQETWGYDPKDKGSWRVFHFGDKDLQRQKFPRKLDEGRYDSCLVEFQHSITIPEFESPYVDIEYGKANREKIDQYFNLKRQVRDFLNEGDYINRLFGHPEQVQGDMQTECQLASHGIYLGDIGARRDPRAKILRPGAIDWDLLLQIDSDGNANMMWGDVGRIYFWIPRKALLARNFDASWMILQCH